jgi:TM2 domain-containing membrane protein YozV
MIPATGSLPARSAFKSKSLTVLLACVGGVAGLHRFYLRGLRDPYGWLHLLGGVLGAIGIPQLIAAQFVSLPGWLCAAAGDISLLAGLLAAIVYGLRPDDKWNAQFNANSPLKSRSNWTVVVLVIVSLFIGACVLMGGLAFAFGVYFEHQAGLPTSLSQ